MTLLNLALLTQGKTSLDPEIRHLLGQQVSIPPPLTTLTAREG